jgi:hypothetical protein
MAFSAQRQFLVTISGIDGKFMTKSGGNISSDSNKIYNGGSTVPSIITSPSEVDNVTVSRAYDQTRDAPILQVLRPQVGRYTATITVQPADADLVAIGKSSVYADAVLVGITEPDYDSSSGDVASFELEWAVATVTN